MLVAAGITAFGLLLVGVISQLFGYRLGGTIAIPVLAVYTLKNAWMLPIFVLSTILAYLGLRIVKQRTLLYGRDELLVAMGIGSGVPLLLLVGFGSLFPESLRSVVFIGSILPGLAAYNYHQLKPEYRIHDLLTAAGLYAGLVACGWLLITPELATTVGEVTPPALYTTTTDVAVYKNAALQTELEPTILARPVAVGLFVLGLFVSERVRGRYGLRMGLIALPLLAIYALASKWLVLLYVVMLGLSFGFLSLVHYVTLLYGRVLISTTTAFALIAAIPITLLLPITRGLSAYFVAILAGIGAYNWHTAPGPKRRLFIPLQLGTFAVMLPLARATGRILPRGFPQRFGVPQLAASVFVAVVCLAIVEYYTVYQPSHDDVFESSILSGGDQE
ncbi:poly-gamma-glutamate biosynthesis protein PgsC/CapC [Halorubrum rutilum]|uniref:Poly-gamma-glutamate biosynthesis protein PgsC/CapC n=1 Tax=Halorubrum rutilum TaxID=1364933 RepID=A0ABD6ANW6_9EURY|nr:poly-gamma-glutamate biosynthesis protein PgsC/CapC [Halorubrum rutilum]